MNDGMLRILAILAQSESQHGFLLFYEFQRAADGVNEGDTRKCGRPITVARQFLEKFVLHLHRALGENDRMAKTVSPTSQLLPMPDLPDDQQIDWAILAMLALYPQGTTVQKLLTNLQALEISLRLRFPRTSATLVQHLRTLHEKGLAQSAYGNHAVCTPEGRDKALYHAWEWGWGKALGNAYRIDSDFEFTRGEVNAQVFRKALFTESWPELQKMFERYSVYNTTPFAMCDDLASAIPKPLNTPWLSSLPLPIAQAVASALLHRCLFRWESPAPLAAWLKELHTKHQSPQILDLLLETLCHMGQFKECRQLVAEKATLTPTVSGIQAYLEGRHKEALAFFDQAWEQLKTQNRRVKIPFIPGAAGWFYVFSLLELGDASLAEKIARIYGGRRLRDRIAGLWDGLLDASLLTQGKKEARHQTAPSAMADHPLQILIHAHVTYWIKPEAFTSANLGTFLDKLIALAEASGMPWFLAQVKALEERHRGKKNRQWALVDLMEAVPNWKRSLESLVRLGLEYKDDRVIRAAKPRRLAWVLEKDPHGGFSVSYALEARDQRQNKNGSWSVGKSIALHKVRSASVGMDFLSAQDQKAIESSTDHPYPETDAVLRVLYALAGHEALFINIKGDLKPLQVRQAEPELRVQKEPEGLALRLFPDCLDRETHAITEDAPDRLTVYAFSNGHRELGRLLGENGLLVPESGREDLVKTVASLAAMVSIHSELPLGESAGLLDELIGDTQPELDLRPWGEGLRLAMRCRPASGGPAFVPGEGAAELILEVEGRRCRVQRDLETEKQRADAVLSQCHALDFINEDREWDLDDPASCLELLLQLEPLRDDLRLLWPEGERFHKPVKVGASRMSLAMKEEGGWFNLEGEVRIDENRVLELQQLFELLPSAKGDFIQLGDGQWLKLEKHFRERLECLCAMSIPGDGKRRLASSAALALDEFTTELGQFKAPKAWKEKASIIRKALDAKIELPKAFQAELRNYQEEGFAWMARLCDAELGACLADDMGLGKTVQSLALLMRRAKGGPALVVAPTSVVGNWAAECVKFAPSLSAHVFGEGDRASQIGSLGASDLLLCSYGLLVQEEELLTSVEWNTVILDEAQAIKNADTRRSQTVMALKAKARVAMSGTPIENHLGELWNLFRFLNPGLLGTMEHFNQTFANPVEKEKDKLALNRLRRVLKPFLLRRTKQEVLEELPPLTEIVHDVELSKEERAYYEALRRKALQRMEKTPAQGGQAQMQMLAELMRLRRACCHPRLVDKEQAENFSSSAKLEAFAEILEELRENHHRVLVFSQFVDHLAVIREYLNENKVPYQYLDGSTSAKDRRGAIEAFQGGEGDCFLISLKAGGTGLNLTAADYVIHMDPWWNPAVEDQASGRAHRMGQQRPVTVYRLVAKNTIEEKILDLHRHKRHLADEILEGSGVATRVNLNELMELLRS